MAQDDGKASFDRPMTISDLDAAFPTNVSRLMPRYEDIPVMFKSSSNEWAQLASMLFFEGGKGVLLTPRPGINTTTAIRHVRAILASFEPKHEHKEAAVAFLLSKWFESYRIDQKARKAKGRS
jgi:hypothetical protein